MKIGCPVPILSIIKSQILGCQKIRIGCQKDGWTGLWLKHCCTKWIITNGGRGGAQITLNLQFVAGFFLYFYFYHSIISEMCMEDIKETINPLSVALITADTVYAKYCILSFLDMLLKKISHVARNII